MATTASSDGGTAMRSTATTIDEYIAEYPPDVRAVPARQPLPVDLIRRIVEFRVAQNTGAASK
jgi:uncharacterized protein YdhG (YjbR/CyaY superfamily)